jgi:release factor glutamine methyltransferase
MTRVLHFIQKPEIRKYNIQNVSFELEVNEHVFPPSPHGTASFAENIQINQNEKVLDIGTGSGILAILAAKFGGKVSATDTSSKAIKLSKENAIRNNVEIDFRQGSYFGEFEEKFDVIIANLPQKIVHRNYQKAIGKKLTQSFSGGLNGNKQILEFLKLAKSHMYGNSRAYLAVYSISDYANTLRAIIKNYNAKLCAFKIVSTKEFVEDNIEYYKKLNEIGKIKIFPIKGKWYAHLYFFELTLK